MKKFIGLLITVAMAISLVACVNVDDLKEQALSGIQDAVNEAKNEVMGLVEDKAGELVGGLSQGVGEAAGEAVGSVLGHDPAYFCELYGQNRCPFSISALGVEFDYHFRNGGTLANWVYTEENTGGWYIYDGYIISADNSFAIKIDEADWFSSCCTYEAKVYTGKTLSKEEQAAQTAGFFHTINSYTPVDTNYGIAIYTNSEEPGEIEREKLTCYGLVDTLKDQEWFSMYVICGWTEDFGESVKLWAMEHRDYSKYPEYLSDEDIEKAVCLGNFNYDGSKRVSCIDAYVPNKESGGFEAGQIDLVITYGDNNNLVVGVATVNTLPAE